MTPLALDLGSSEIIIIVLIALVLFGGSRLAGLGKSAGRAIREFKEETGGSTPTVQPAPPGTPPVTSTAAPTATPTVGEQIPADGPHATPPQRS